MLVTLLSMVPRLNSALPTSLTPPRDHSQRHSGTLPRAESESVSARLKLEALRRDSLEILARMAEDEWKLPAGLGVERNVGIPVEIARCGARVGQCEDDGVFARRRRHPMTESECHLSVRAVGGDISGSGRLRRPVHGQYCDACDEDIRYKGEAATN